MSNASRLPLARLLPVLATLLSLAACRNEIDDTYGRRSGRGAQSVNGTAVLGEMFQSAGHTVYTRSALTPRVRDKAQCIVWFPDDLDPPSPEVRRWLADWIAAAPDRTLIYVGRDYDAWPFYWKKIGKPAPPGGIIPWRSAKPAKDKDKAETQDDSAEDAADEPSPEDKGGSLASNPVWHNAEVPDDEYDEYDGDYDNLDDEPNQWDAPRELDLGLVAPWFTTQDEAKPCQVRTLHGDAEWLAGIDPTGLEIELNSRMIPAEEAETLLKSEDDMLVGRMYAGRGQILLVANGSFLLNVPLVNHEHRKLAGKMIDAIGPAGQTVVFLESGPGGPPIRDNEPQAKTPSGFDILLEYPYFWIFLHVAMVCTVYCFARWPLFGLPRELPPPPVSDFGRHIDAMAELLRRSRDRAFAFTKLIGYRQKSEEKRRSADKART